MKPILPNYSDSGVLIVGDVMLDRYWYGPTGRISPEAPVPVVKVEKQRRASGWCCERGNEHCVAWWPCSHHRFGGDG